MTRILNLICPASHLEHFIAKKTGDKNIVNYFVTSLGLGFHLHKHENAEQLKAALQRLEIEEIRLFQDVYCPFIQNVLKKSRPKEFFIDYVLEDIYSEQIVCPDFTKADDDNKAKKLAEKNLVRQMKALQLNPILASYIVQRKLVLKGIVIHKAEGKVISEIDYSTRFSA